MQVLFVHQNFPAQFGHIAEYLIRNHRFRCAFATARPPRASTAIDVIPYQPVRGATQHNSYFTRTFENTVAHAHGVYLACRSRPDLRPDLVVAHSGFGSSLFLRELYDCPIINYFEYFYHPHGSDLDFRPDFPPLEQDVLRSYTRNAMLLLDLENCTAGYAPTEWQRSRLPVAYRPKVTTIFDGIDTKLWRRHDDAPRRILGRDIPDNVRIVTYVSRGFELMRGFDVFLEAAKRIYAQWPHVLFAVVGEDRVAYGGDERHTGGRPLRQVLLEADDYDPGKFLFTGSIPPDDLARLLSVSDLHIYLTMPFVLSWSLFNALACGATVLASDTAPVKELIEPERTGLLADFFDVDGFAEQALAVLRDPPKYRKLGQAGQALIRDKYALDHTLPRMLRLYEQTISGSVRPASSGVLTNHSTEQNSARTDFQ